MNKKSAPIIRHHLCGNCLMPLTSVYCSHCGQKQISQSKHFSTLIKEFFQDVLNFDDKILRTIKPLLFRPGFLSLEYFADRRMHYVSPLKLYFLLSVITFFLVQQSVENNVNPDKLIQLNDDDAKTAESKGINIDWNGKPWNAKTNPAEIPWIPDAGNQLFNDRLIKLDAVLKSKDAQKQLMHAGLAAIPQALLIMLPFFALMLKFAYWFQKRLYMEHLIVALHNHAFLLTYILCLVVANQLGLWWSASISWLQPVIETLNNLLWMVLPVYFFLSLKRIYRQGWRKTALKFSLLGFFYVFLLCFGLTMILAIGLMTL